MTPVDPYVDAPVADLPQHPERSGLEPGIDDLWPVLDWHGLWDMTTAEAQWLAEPLLERGRSAVLYSPPKAGKSLLALEVAAGLSAGRSVLGNPPRARITVLYVDLENTGADVRSRLEALGYGPDDLDRLRYLSFPSLAAMDTPVGGRQLVSVVDHHHADLVVIDTVSRVVAGEENAADTWAALYRYALAPLKGRGVSVLRLDHAGKDADRGQRGSSAKSADVDHVWRLSTSSDRVTLTREASRTGNGADRLELDRRTSPLRHLPTTQTYVAPRVTSLMVALDELGVAPDAGGRVAREALRKAGYSVSNDVVADVVRVRKARSDVSGTHEPLTEPVEDALGVPVAIPPNRESAGQACPGHTADTSGPGPAEQGGADVSVSPPLRGGHVTAHPLAPQDGEQQ